MTQQFADLITFPVMRRLREPLTPEDLKQCNKVKAALETMELRYVQLAFPGEPYFAVLAYKNGPKPKAWWAQWLWVQIGPTREDCIGWLGYMSGFDAGRRELYFSPRPERIDSDLARQARDKAPGHRLNYAKLGVLYPPPSKILIFTREH